jgi:hypothetical protein
VVLKPDDKTQNTNTTWNFIVKDQISGSAPN